MEASFSGADKGELKDTHFSTENFMLVGRRLLEALLIYCKIDVNSCIQQLQVKNKKETETNLKKSPTDISSIKV